jgi:hypothetical protein
LCLVMKKGGRQVCGSGSSSCAAIIPAADAQLCAGCKLVCYCGRSCQKVDWKTHKPKCNAEAEACEAQEQRGAADMVEGNDSRVKKRQCTKIEKKEVCGEHAVSRGQSAGARWQSQ